MNRRSAVDGGGDHVDAQGAGSLVPCRALTDEISDAKPSACRLLLPDGQFELSTQALGRQSSRQTTLGRFAWHDDGSGVTLDAAGAGQQFRVGEGRLLQLDRDGTAIPWNTPGRVLTKIP